MQREHKADGSSPSDHIRKTVTLSEACQVAKRIFEIAEAARGVETELVKAKKQLRRLDRLISLSGRLLNDWGHSPTSYRINALDAKRKELRYHIKSKLARL